MPLDKRGIVCYIVITMQTYKVKLSDGHAEWWEKLEAKNEELNNFLIAYKNEISNFLKTKDISFDKIQPNKNSALIVLTSLSVLIPLDGIIDSEAELKKLNKKKQVEQEKFNKVNEKLNNNNFMNKASEEIINKFKNEANIYKSSIEKIDQIINTIK